MNPIIHIGVVDFFLMKSMLENHLDNYNKEKIMRKAYVDFTVLLDRSGSMAMIESDMIGGFNTFMNKQKEIPGDMKVSLFQFDTEFEKVYEEVDIHLISPLILVPRGGTALLDSLHKAIILTKERLDKLDKDKKPSQVYFMIITDGAENSSMEIRRERVKKLTESQEKESSWEFIYLGANQDAFAVGAQIGVNNCSTFSSNPGGMARACQVVTQSVNRYKTSGIAEDLQVEASKHNIVKSTPPDVWS